MILAHLNAFCSDSDRQPVLQAPWSEVSHSYASNGNILIRVDRLQEVPEREDAPRNVDAILLNKDARTPYTAIQEPAGSDMEGCPTCKGTGRCDCPRCSASHDCGTCKGFGAVDTYTPVGDQHFKTKSVRLLRALAVEWQVTGQPSVFFRFEGGMGVVLAKARTEAAGSF